MARTAKLRIGDRPQPAVGKYCPLAVGDIHVGNSEVTVTLEHTSPELEGVMHELTRPQPLNPLGLVAALIRACAIKVEENTSIDPKAIMGKVVHARFVRRGDGQIVIESFRNCSQENRHESSTQSESAPAPDVRS